MSYVNAFTYTYFPDVLQARGRRQRAPRPARPDDRDRCIDPAQRRDVGVVVVQVRDQDRVQRRGQRGQRRVATQVRDARAQDRVGQDARAGEVAEDGGVAEPDEASHVVLAM